MGEVEIREQEALVLPTGEIISLADAAACAFALNDLRRLEERIREAKRALTEAVVAESRRLGSKTVPLKRGWVAEVKGGERLLWDAQLLEADLRAAGMPEARLRQIVVEEVSYKVSAVEARRAAGANEEYARAVEAARQTLEEAPSVLVRKAG